MAVAMEMAKSKTILDLNDDCVAHLLTFMPDDIVWKFIKAFPIWTRIFMKSFDTRPFSIEEFQSFCLFEKMEEFLIDHGKNIKHVGRNGYAYMPATAKYMQLLQNYIKNAIINELIIELCDISCITFVVPTKSEIDLCYELINMKQIKSIVLTDVGSEHWQTLRNPVKSYQHFREFRFARIPGFTVADAIEICTKNELNTLHFDPYEMQEGTNFIASVCETQTKLKSLQIGYNFTFNQEGAITKFDQFARLENLNELIFECALKAELVISLLRLFTDNVLCKLRVLKLCMTDPADSRITSVDWKRLLHVKNLKILHICLKNSPQSNYNYNYGVMHYGNGNNGNIPNYDKVKSFIRMPNAITTNDIKMILTGLEMLKEFELISSNLCLNVGTKLLEEIAEIRNAKKCPHLKTKFTYKGDHDELVKRVSRHFGHRLDVHRFIYEDVEKVE